MDVRSFLIVSHVSLDHSCEYHFATSTLSTSPVPTSDSLSFLFTNCTSLVSIWNRAIPGSMTSASKAIALLLKLHPVSFSTNSTPSLALML
ncbi:unnamed protein product [Periconia digitata]|uniref:Uncharacterized protein n=1 Tax=Periconia digitata TaxID=1303443 RepID=A0A9W4UVT3_9PLEO|nr:unnamed protein product [Periconia digitata]